MSDSAVEWTGNELMELKDAGGGKGLGYFATRAIKPGETILEETTKIHWAHDSMSARSKVDRWVEIYRGMNENEQRAWNALAICDKIEMEMQFRDVLADKRNGDGSPLTEEQQEHFVQLCMKTEINCFGSDRFACGVFLKASRFNHSCEPNVWWEYDNEDHWIAHATRHIARGEELVIAYARIAPPTRYRQRCHMDMWGFTCQCVRCVGGIDTYTASLQEARSVAKNEQAENVVIPTFRVDEEYIDMALRTTIRIVSLKDIINSQEDPDICRKKELIYVLRQASILHRHYLLNFQGYATEHMDEEMIQRQTRHCATEDYQCVKEAAELAESIWGPEYRLVRILRFDEKMTQRIAESHKNPSNIHENRASMEAPSAKEDDELLNP